jgi:tripartite-type tricarboxylate transporter receptor subunit TctC
MRSLGTSFTLVPYKGTGPAMTDLIPGHVDMMCDSIITAAPQVKAGMIKTYGVTGHERSSFVPDVPTLDEQGMKGVDYKVWSGLYAPKKTPKAVIDRLDAALGPALADPAFQQASVNLGQEIATGELVTPAGGDLYLKSEIARWGSLLQGSKPSN